MFLERIKIRNRLFERIYILKDPRNLVTFNVTDETTQTIYIYIIFAVLDKLLHK